MAILFIEHDLQIYEVISAAILVLLTAALAGVLLLGVWRPGAVASLLAWVQSFVNRVGDGSSVPSNSLPPRRQCSKQV
ncbi:MAG: hypothetical protein ACOYZ6_08855 [Chloroflexota bacterium]